MSNLIHRTVDGWDLCSRDGAAWWIRDLELAARAGLAKPRGIRSVIRAVLAEGLVSAEVHSGLAEGAVIVAEKSIVPLANGGHQEVTEYLLNRKAALLVVMRLRTDKAVELTDAVVTVFLRVVDGTLAGEELRVLREHVAKLSAQVLETRNTLLLGSGIACPRENGLVRSAKARAAHAYVAAGMFANLAAAHRALQNGVANLGWGGAGQRAGLMPSGLVSRVLAYLEHEEAKARRFAKTRAQIEIPGVGNVVPLKRRGRSQR